MSKDPLYYKGYIAGYWDGVKDHASGKVADGQSSDIGKMPIQAMALSNRTRNCLVNCGYTHVENLIALNRYDIMRMRNVGSKTIAEIAEWLTGHGVYCSAWSEFL